MEWNTRIPRALIVAVLAITFLVGVMLLAALLVAPAKEPYELIKDLFVPLIGPFVAVLIPVVVLFIIPYGQTRQKLALDLCTQYFSEEMREARNIGWRHFVTEQRQEPPIKRAERLNRFLDYLSVPEVHRAVDAEVDATYQKTSRVLDFFALVNGCIARGVADPDLVRDFLLFYYLWWRDEIMDPMRRTNRIIADHPKVRPVWWEPLKYLDALAERQSG
jgi:hypothetical protein